jgi:uncharacterized iron-regulated membrane protein
VKQNTIKNLIEAHGWLGITISGILFITLFSGSISLFRLEILWWSVVPTQAVHTEAQMSVGEVIASVVKDKSVDFKQDIKVLKEHGSPFYEVTLDLINEDGTTGAQHYLVDAVSGEIIGLFDQFFLPEFIFQLHESLNLPGGTYIVGFVCLFFFVVLLSGIVFHFKKIGMQFFQYRSKGKKKDKLLDMHKVIGVISLPFSLMYAITGLIFTLVIIYQIAFALVLYKSDQQSLLKDAGVYFVSQEWLDKPMKPDNIDNVVGQISLHYNNAPRFVRVFNYGDQSAVIQALGYHEGQLGHEYDVALRLFDNSEVFRHDKSQYSYARYGTDFMEALHYGNYGGVGLKLVYFVLGIMVCGLVITGNLVWIAKHQQERSNSRAKSVKILYPLTLATTLGVVISLSAVFLVERAMPPDLINREHSLVLSFLITLCLSAVGSVMLSAKRFIQYSFICASVMLVSVVILEWILYTENLLSLWQAGFYPVFGVELGLLCIAAVFAVCAYVNCTSNVQQVPQPLASASI